ncbi:ecto-ADP-ribosyltransferase 4 [Microcaecilia unicolor]|uniref:NAD(P)(+)--arginine ADP-ribosyltransferase n=1 Tax=Microcaecilia unicolor TaxID=1415580 RepID=A0A6P7XB85_9AMPH|nr:ecto-ADP-ribosyltransferase 4-like [Microcaecilia unicolor]XP_030049769.1 ecto-ADP-ribosyltransferase 4-like [Microcaecilia unicolor]XP_030049770.1 ecto-ADP-ribosyltransferase 4-like [Microcaecilia unicolor]
MIRYLRLLATAITALIAVAIVVAVITCAVVFSNQNQQGGGGSSIISIPHIIYTNSDNEDDDEPTIVDELAFKMGREGQMDSQNPTVILQTLFKNQTEWAPAWRRAKQRASNLSLPIPMDYLTALVFYIDNQASIAKTLKKVQGESSHFPQPGLQILHFLSHGLWLLKQFNPGCYSGVYGGVSHTLGVHAGSLVRFDYLAVLSLERQVTQDSRNGSLVIVCTCHGVLLQNITESTLGKIVLIPPYEAFRVERHEGSTYYLSSVGTCSGYRCGVLEDKTEKCKPNQV